MKKITSILIVTIFIFLYCVEPAFAAVPPQPQTPKEPVTVGVAERPDSYPYKKLFMITAYYRPMPNQAHYATGSYEAEVRLNGDKNGADGTPVYPGMVAAPKSYKFGTKMYIPSVGIVAIHDRGGAIVEVGKRNQQYDRLDIWMGAGDIALDRTLAWGRRVREVVVYGQDSSIKEEVFLDGYTLDEQKLASAVISGIKSRQYKIFTHDIWYLSKGEDVKKLQNTLYQFGYLAEKPNGVYGKATRNAVFDFQRDNDVVTSWEENGAGHTGPQTRWKLEVISTAFNKEKFPRSGMRKGSKGDDVKRLQKILKDLGYTVEEAETFDDQTATAVAMFQIDQGLLPTADSTGIGVFGPKTRDLFIRKYLAKLASDKSYDYDTEAPNELDPKFFEKDLQLGDKGLDVAFLQKELSKMGYLRMKPTGYFGVLTKHAVFKFQQALALMDTEKNPRAGLFGPTTRGRLNSMIAERAQTKRLIAANTKSANQLIAAQSTPKIIAQIITDEIDFGESGEQVRNLQNALKKLGYFKSGFVSGYFGEETRKAVLTFQKDKGIIASEADTGAGRVGPSTKEILNKVFNS